MDLASAARMRKSHGAALSRHLSRSLAELRAEFSDYAALFGSLATRRAEVAERFFAAFTAYHRETGHTFVAFVHELDPTVPAERSEYTKHRSFQAALYLRRLVERPQTQAKFRATRSPFDVLASCIRGILPSAAPHEEVYWSQVRRVSGWRDRDIERLRDRVAKARPIPLPTAPRHVPRREVAYLHDASAERSIAAAH